MIWYPLGLNSGRGIHILHYVQIWTTDSHFHHNNYYENVSVIILFIQQNALARPLRQIFYLMNLRVIRRLKLSVFIKKTSSTYPVYDFAGFNRNSFWSFACVPFWCQRLKSKQQQFFKRILKIQKRFKRLLKHFLCFHYLTYSHCCFRHVDYCEIVPKEWKQYFWQPSWLILIFLLSLTFRRRNKFWKSAKLQCFFQNCFQLQASLEA